MLHCSVGIIKDKGWLRETELQCIRDGVTTIVPQSAELVHLKPAKFELDPQTLRCNEKPNDWICLYAENIVDKMHGTSCILWAPTPVNMLAVVRSKNSTEHHSASLSSCFLIIVDHYFAVELMYSAFQREYETSMWNPREPCRYGIQ